MIPRLVFLMAFAVLVTACSSDGSAEDLSLTSASPTPSATAPEPSVTAVPATEEAETPDETGCPPVAYDSVEDLGRLFVATPGGAALAQVEIEVMEAYRPAGLLVRAFNVGGREALQELLAQVHTNGESLALVDHEGGDVQLPMVEPRIPSALRQGQATPDETRATAALVGADLKALGFDINLAPVADVRVEGYNTVTSRSYGNDPALVGEHVLAFAAGLREAGLVPAVKHFPGYGRAVGDAHLQLTTVGTPLEELMAVDLPPFQQAIDAGLPVMMLSHLHYSAIDPANQPSTISEPLITGLLRQQMGFRGVVITDSLGMGAITLTVGTGEGAVLALKAGADMLLLTANVTEVPAFAQRVASAVESGQLPRSRVEQALARVAALQGLARGLPAPCLLP